LNSIIWVVVKNSNSVVKQMSRLPPIIPIDYFNALRLNNHRQLFLLLHMSRTSTYSFNSNREQEPVNEANDPTGCAPSQLTRVCRLVRSFIGFWLVQRILIIFPYSNYESKFKTPILPKFSNIYHFNFGNQIIIIEKG
jgi:hypothetical protein